MCAAAPHPILSVVHAAKRAPPGSALQPFLPYACVVAYTCNAVYLAVIAVTRATARTRQEPVFQMFSCHVPSGGIAVRPAVARAEEDSAVSQLPSAAILWLRRCPTCRT